MDTPSAVLTNDGVRVCVIRHCATRDAADDDADVDDDARGRGVGQGARRLSTTTTTRANVASRAVDRGDVRDAFARR